MRNVIEVPYLDQSVKYPTGCESVSAVMLLRYLGYEITVDEFIEQLSGMQRYGNERRKALWYRIRMNISVEVPMMKILSGFMQKDF